MKRFGTVTPSSNVMVEEVTQAILRDLDGVSAHFSRIPFAGTRDDYPDDYDWDGMLEAARLLGAARPDLICWNGSKGGSIGFDKDRELCRRFTAETGVDAVTSTLALDEILRQAGLGRIAFVTPYAQELQSKIKGVWESEGYSCVASCGAGLSDNYSYSTLSRDAMLGMAREVAGSRPEAIVFYCTNMPGASLVAELEEETGVAVYDSVSVAVWKCLRLLGIDTAPAGKWGSLFVRH